MNTLTPCKRDEECENCNRKSNSNVILLHTLSKAEKQELLSEAGITVDMPPEQGLALKATLHIPWKKLHVIRRYIVFLLLHF